MSLHWVVRPTSRTIFGSQWLGVPSGPNDAEDLMLVERWPLIGSLVQFHVQLQITINELTLASISLPSYIVLHSRLRHGTPVWPHALVYLCYVSSSSTQPSMTLYFIFFFTLFSWHKEWTITWAPCFLFLGVVKYYVSHEHSCCDNPAHIQKQQSRAAEDLG